MPKWQDGDTILLRFLIRDHDDLSAKEVFTIIILNCHLWKYRTVSFSICLFTLQLLIGFELGAVVMWDLKTKLADVRFSCHEVRVASSDTIQYFHSLKMVRGQPSNQLWLGEVKLCISVNLYLLPLHFFLPALCSYY